MCVKTINYWKNVNEMCLRFLEKTGSKMNAKILKRLNTDLKILNLVLVFKDGISNLLLDLTEKIYLILLKKTRSLIITKLLKLVLKYTTLISKYGHPNTLPNMITS